MMQNRHPRRRNGATCEFQSLVGARRVTISREYHGRPCFPNRPTSLGNSLAISGIRTGWSSRYARVRALGLACRNCTCLTGCPLSRWKQAAIKLSDPFKCSVPWDPNSIAGSPFGKRDCSPSEINCQKWQMLLYGKCNSSEDIYEYPEPVNLGLIKNFEEFSCTRGSWRNYADSFFNIRHFILIYIHYICIF